MDSLVQRVVDGFLDRHGKGTSRGWEKRRERDQLVENNIEHMEPHLLTLWRKTKNLFKGDSTQRFERFMDYVHDHPDEGMAAAADAAEKKWKREEKAFEKEQKAEYEAALAAAKAAKELEAENRRVRYEERTPKQVYTEIASQLKDLNG